MLPFFTFLYVRRSDSGYTVTRDQWDKEYDYVIGESSSFYARHVSFMSRSLLRDAKSSETPLNLNQSHL